jgi:hypothetical protein
MARALQRYARKRSGCVRWKRRKYIVGLVSPALGVGFTRRFDLIFDRVLLPPILALQLMSSFSLGRRRTCCGWLEDGLPHFARFRRGLRTSFLQVPSRGPFGLEA